MAASEVFSKDWFLLLGLWLVILAAIVGLWRSSLRIKNKYLKWICWLIAGLFTGASAIVFFASCLGIGYAGCM